MKAVRVKEVIAKAKQIYGIEEEAEREDEFAKVVEGEKHTLEEERKRLEDETCYKGILLILNKCASQVENITSLKNETKPTKKPTQSNTGKNDSWLYTFNLHKSRDKFDTGNKSGYTLLQLG